MKLDNIFKFLYLCVGVCVCVCVCVCGTESSLHSGVGVEGEDVPSFVVEHLATFAVSQQNEVVYPADGMRRLLQMEKTSGIWTQKMMLRLDRDWITIADFENGEVVERFPMMLIHEPTAFTSKDPKDLYNNIFIFVIGEDPVHHYPPEMHIFQCVGVSSQVVVDDLKMFMAGNVRLAEQGSVASVAASSSSAAAAAAAATNRIPPPPNKPPPEPPLNGVAVIYPKIKQKTKQKKNKTKKTKKTKKKQKKIRKKKSTNNES